MCLCRRTDNQKTPVKTNSCKKNPRSLIIRILAYIYNYEKMGF